MLFEHAASGRFTESHVVGLAVGFLSPQFPHRQTQRCDVNGRMGEWNDGRIYGRKTERLYRPLLKAVRHKTGRTY